MKASESAKAKISKALKGRIKTAEHLQKISQALMGRETKPAIERFMSKVEKSCDGCWNWRGSIAPNGYGKFSIEKNRIRKTFNAHRFSYQYFKGEIPHGLTIDHLCRNRGCVNPDHLEVLTLKENLLRGSGVGGRNAKKTHCSKGHTLVYSPYPSHQIKKRRYCPIYSGSRKR